MSNVKIILYQLKLININEIKGKILEQEDPLYWNDKIFVFADDVIGKLKALEKINKESEFSTGDFKLTVIEFDKEYNHCQWKLEQIIKNKKGEIKIEPLAHGYYNKERRKDEGEKITLLLSLAPGQEWFCNKFDLYKFKNFKSALKKFYYFLFKAEICLEEYYKRFEEHCSTTSEDRNNDSLESFIRESIRNESILQLAKVYDKSGSAISLLRLNEILYSNCQNWKKQGKIDSIYSINEIKNYCQSVEEKILEWEKPSQNINLLRNERDKCICHIDIEEMFKLPILNSRERNNSFNESLGGDIKRKQLEELIDYGKEVFKKYAELLGLDLFPFYETYKLKILERDKRG